MKLFSSNLCKLMRINRLQGFYQPVLSIISQHLNSPKTRQKKEEASSETSSCGDFVRWARLELAQDYSHYPLNVACLPFHHHRFCFGTANIRTIFISANFFNIFCEIIRFSSNKWTARSLRGSLLPSKFRFP